MKSEATLEDYQNREKFLIRYLQSQILKADTNIGKYSSYEDYGKSKAYKDLLFKLTEFKIPKVDVEYLEVHHDIVAQVTLWEEQSNEGTLISKAREESGQGGIYELCQKWTDEFQETYEGVEWGEFLEYYEVIEMFLNDKNSL
jgi:hypothetical protein